MPAVRSGAGFPACASGVGVSPSRSVPGTSGVAVGPGRRFPGGRDVTWWRPLLTPGHPPVRVTAPPCVVTHRTRTDPQARCPGGASGPVSAAGDPPASWSRAAADEDRGAGEQRAAQRAPLAPHRSRGPPATPARPGRPAPARRRRRRGPVAQRAVVLDVGRHARRRRPRRRACGRSTTGSTVSPPWPGSSGNIHRIGWFTANTHRPPGRSTRATSRITRSGSATNGTAPNAEQARSKRAVGERQPLGVGLHQRHGDAGRGVERGRVPQHPAERSRRDRPAPWVGEPARARRRAAADLQHPAPGDVAEQARVGLAQALRAPDEVDVADGARRARRGSRRRRRPTSARLARCDSRGADGAARDGRRAEQLLGARALHRRPVAPAIVPRRIAAARRRGRVALATPGPRSIVHALWSTWRLLADRRPAVRHAPP